MINTINIKNKKSNILVENLKDNILFLPKWEEIRTFYVVKNKFFFRKEQVKLHLLRKFSSKNMLEKYIINSDENDKLGYMDLRIYKDCVYIINLELKNCLNTQNVLPILIQTAIEKSLYNTSEKTLKINLNIKLNIKNKVKKFLSDNEFKIEENQSNYEKEMFGETFSFTMERNSKWAKRIKKMPILINED